MIKSRLTHKAQTTIPQAVRAALKLSAGDEIAYIIEDQQVILVKVGPTAVDDHFATFWEWNSDLDAQAFRDL